MVRIPSGIKVRHPAFSGPSIEEYGNPTGDSDGDSFPRNEEERVSPGRPPRESGMRIEEGEIPESHQP
jgi:hypothetical protein